jgi:hypothetical protein
MRIASTSALSLVLLLCSALVPIQALHAQRLDPGFGTNGRVLIRFDDIVPDADADAVVACAGAAGTLIVAGIAGAHVVSVRLLEDGTLDTRFGIGGRQRFPLPVEDSGYRERVGACQADGNLLMAYAARGQGFDQNLVVMRLLAASGLPDPQFGTAGHVILDLDAHAAGLEDRETPLGLNVSADGMIDLSGSVAYSQVPQTRGFIARLRADGSLARAWVLNETAMLGFSLTSAMASSGQLYAIGSATTVGEPSSFILYRMDPATLLVRSTVRGDAPLLRVGRGRWVGEGIFAAVAHRAVANGPDQPVLLVARASGVSTLELPMPERVAGREGELLHQEHDGDVVPLPDGGVLATYTVDMSGDGTFGRGLHSVRVRLGARVEEEDVDSGYGRGGRFSVRHDLACGADAPLFHRRTTLWNGRVTWVGSAQVPDCQAIGRRGFWIARLQALPMFADGFE